VPPSSCGIAIAEKKSWACPPLDLIYYFSMTWTQEPELKLHISAPAPAKSFGSSQLLLRLHNTAYLPNKLNILLQVVAIFWLQNHQEF
jgi:hypothetical protein